MRGRGGPRGRFLAKGGRGGGCGLYGSGQGRGRGHPQDRRRSRGASIAGGEAEGSRGVGAVGRGGRRHSHGRAAADPVEV